MNKLANHEIEAKLAGLAGWRLSDNSLKKELKFTDFATAMKFINQLAGAAEALNHHPDWSNSYNKVSLSLTSHSAGGVTDEDFQLAARVDQIATSLPQMP